MVQDMVGVQSLIRSYKKIAEKLSLECLFVFNLNYNYLPYFCGL